MFQSKQHQKKISAFFHRDGGKFSQVNFNANSDVVVVVVVVSMDVASLRV